MNQYFKLVLISTLLLFTISVSGQLNYKAGFIITLENDTVFGKINDGGQIRNSKICLFKEINGKKVVKYKPGEIKAYRFNGDKNFRSEKIFFRGTYKSVFLEVLLDGTLNLYYHWQNKDMSYYIEKDDGLLIGLINKDLNISRKSDYGRIVYSNYYDVKIPVYKDTLASIFSDCKKIQNQISGIDYSPKSLLDISTDYIIETCTSKKCINYTKDLSMYKSRFGIYSGIQFNKIVFLSSNNAEKTKIFQSYSIGLLFNFPLSLLNDRLSFQFELLATSVDIYNDPKYADYFNFQSRTLGLPVLLKYELKRKKISPSFAIGKSNYFVLDSKVTEELELNSFQKGGMLFELGINYKISKKISLFSNFRVDSFKNRFNSSDESSMNFKPNKNPYVNRTNASGLSIGVRF